MKSFLRNNGLSIALMSVFMLTLIGQYITGWNVYREDELQHGRTPVALSSYVTEGHFLEALFENWESEFLQMAAFVVFTVFLFQKGSSESKRPGAVERVDLILPESKDDPEMPWPVRRGGIALKLYEHSLAIAFLALFVFSFVLHLYGGAQEYNSSRLEHGEPSVTMAEFLSTSQFWFESFQNWQSEFLSIAMMVILSIFLRQRGSPESKPVDSPHSETAG
jgi:hypothetical protein